MAIASTLQTIANEARSHFYQIKRGEQSIWTRKDDAPQWVQDMVFAAHEAGDMWPDDWRYAFIVESLDALADHDDADSARDSIEADIYTSDLTSWLNSRADRTSYVDDAREEFGESDNGIVGMLQMGQLAERWEVFDSIVSFLADRLPDDDDIIDDVTEALRQLSGDSSWYDDEIGTVDDAIGWNARFDGPITRESLESADFVVSEDVANELGAMAGAILHADSDGFYDSTIYQDAETLEAAWNAIVAQCDDSDNE